MLAVRASRAGRAGAHTRHAVLPSRTQYWSGGAGAGTSVPRGTVRAVVSVASTRGTAPTGNGAGHLCRGVRLKRAEVASGAPPVRLSLPTCAVRPRCALQAGSQSTCSQVGLVSAGWAGSERDRRLEAVAAPGTRLGAEFRQLCLADRAQCARRTPCVDLPGRGGRVQVTEEASRTVGAAACTSCRVETNTTRPRQDVAGACTFVAWRTSNAVAHNTVPSAVQVRAGTAKRGRGDSTATVCTLGTHQALLLVPQSSGGGVPPSRTRHLLRDAGACWAVVSGSTLALRGKPSAGAKAAAKAVVPGRTPRALICRLQVALVAEAACRARAQLCHRARTQSA